MLVEDDNSLREIYQARLMAEGYETVTAKDGEEALVLIGQEKPDLIILDIMMPKISGFDTLDILRSTPATKYTKVIIMSALSQAEDKARAEKLGANKYLVKSQVTLEDIVKSVKEVLGSSDPNSTDIPKDLDIVAANLGTTSEQPKPDSEASKAPEKQADIEPVKPLPDAAEAQAAVDAEAKPTSEEAATIVSEEAQDMKDEVTLPTEDLMNSENPTPSETPNTGGMPTSTDIPDDTHIDTSISPEEDNNTPEPENPTQDGSQVTSDPNPLSETPAIDNAAPSSSDPINPVDSISTSDDSISNAAPSYSNSPSEGTSPPKVAPDPLDEEKKSHLQELIEKEEGNGDTPQTPSPAA